MCKALTNNGSIAPWLSDISTMHRNLMLLIFLENLPSREFRLHYAILSLLQKYTYETIWRELVDLYPFFAEEADNTNELISKQSSTPEVK